MKISNKTYNLGELFDWERLIITKNCSHLGVLKKNLCNRQLYTDMMHLMSCYVRLMELAMFACYGATIMLVLLNACDIGMKDITILRENML